jgi:site-specific DNA-methyltransferase (adenine-specific)
MKGRDVLFSHKNDNWETPKWLFDKLDEEFHFDLDAACNPENCLSRTGYGYAIGEDALKADWSKFMMDNGEDASIFFLNPPYSQISAFMKKAYEESLKGAVVVCLIPVRSDTRYWHDYVMKADEIRFIKGRLKFTNPLVPDTTSATFPSCVVVFDSTDYGWCKPRLGTTIISPVKSLSEIKP